MHHDAALLGHGPIEQLTSAQLPDWLPSLGEALEVCCPLRVNVEIKHEPERDKLARADALATEVARLLTARPWAASRVVVSSFSLEVHRRRAGACAATLATALLVEPAADADGGSRDDTRARA